NDELQSASKCIAPYTVAQLSLTNPWPTREMSGVEVLVEDTFAYDLAKFLPIPKASNTSVHHTPSIMIPISLHVLWIIGDKKLENIENLIKDIQNLQNTSKLSTHLDDDHKLTVVQTIEEAQQWLKTNKELIRKPHIRLKVVTLWTIQNDKTAIDVIRAVRSELSQVPVLIFTNKRDEIPGALEFPNVIATEKEFEVKEFVGVNQETLWNAGCRVSHIEPIVSQKDYAPPLQNAVTTGSENKLENSSTLPYPSTANEQGFPLLPIIDVFPVRSYPPSPSNSSIPKTPNTSSLKPMLLWIDIPQNDPKTTNEIKKRHPTLEIVFKSSYKDAEEYLINNLPEIQKNELFITICRGYFVLEQKGFTHVAQLFEGLRLGTRRLAVYTSSKSNLLKHTPNPPKSVEIIDEQLDLLDFIDDCLKPKS
ncbi:unnamed protein product, partial [Rotaria sp. Silwood2]